jgi:hypothetical protein
MADNSVRTQAVAALWQIILILRLVFSAHCYETDPPRHPAKHINNNNNTQKDSSFWDHWVTKEDCCSHVTWSQPNLRIL